MGVKEVLTILRSCCGVSGGFAGDTDVARVLGGGVEGLASTILGDMGGVAEYFVELKGGDGRFDEVRPGKT